MSGFEDSDENDDEDISLIAQLVNTNFLQSQSTSSALVDELTERAEKAEASLAAIRDRIISLFNQDYLPSTKIVLEGLFPPVSIIKEYRNRASEQ